MNMERIETIEKLVKFICWIGLLLFILARIIPESHAQTFKQVTLSWDAPPATDLPNIKSTRIYEIKGGVYTQVSEATCSGSPNVCPLQVTFDSQTAAAHNWVARFWDGFQETADSNAVLTPPGPPKNLRK
jgi:hypothetical protein